jgi:hypothetical protein
VLTARFAICRTPPGLPAPEWATAGGFCSFTRTKEELSIVCEESRVPQEVQAERGWACLKLHGPFPFDLTGVLAAVLNPLAGAEIGIFAVSTFDTDYVLIKSDRLQAAQKALAAAGLELVTD